MCDVASSNGVLPHMILRLSKLKVRRSAKEIASPSAVVTIASASSIIKILQVCRLRFRGACPAQNLIELVAKPETMTEQGFAHALKPIRAFYSRHGSSAGMTFPTIATPSSSSEVCTPTSSQMPLF